MKNNTYSDLMKTWANLSLRSSVSTEFYKNTNELLHAYSQLMSTCKFIPDTTNIALKNMASNISSAIMTSDTKLAISNLSGAILNSSEILKVSRDAIHTLVSQCSEQESSTDYIIVDESAIEEFKIKDSIAIPVGNRRFRIGTDTFISILGILISIVITIASNAENHMDFAASDKINSQRLEQEQKYNQLLQEQNRRLSDLLESLDTSNSTQKEYLEDIRSAYQAQNEVPDSPESSADNLPEFSKNEPDKQ